MSQSVGLSRRQFLKRSSVAAAASTFPAINRGLGAKGDDKARVGVVGCGGRGTGAALNALLAPTRVRTPEELHFGDAPFPEVATPRNYKFY